MPLDRRRRALAAALVFLVTLVAMEALAVLIILPTIRHDLGGLGWYAWVISAFQLTQIAAIPVTGRLLDRVNPAIPLVLGIVAFGGGLGVAATAPTMPILVLGRALQGFGGGAIPAIAYVCVGRGFDEDQRPRIFALMSSAWVIPSVASPVLARVISRFFGWRWVFGGLIPLTVIAGALAVPAVRALGRVQPDGDPEAEPPRRPAMVLPSLVLVAGAVGIIGGFAIDQPAVAIIVGVAGMVVAATAFRRLTPEGTLLARHGVPATVLTRGLLTFAFFATDAFVSLLLQTIRGTGEWYSSVAYGAASFTWTCGSWIQARSSGTRTASHLNQAGLATVGAGAAMMVLVPLTSVPTWVVVVAWGIGGLGIGVAYPQQALVVLNTSPPGQEGFATAALQLSDVLGVAIGSGIGGVIIVTAKRWGDGLAHGLAVVFAMSVIVSVVGLAVARRMPHAPMAPVDRAELQASAGESASVAAAVLEETGRQGI